ncbi:MAG: zinc ribbon domain-containing protein [Kiritimatiellia bacterium]
MPIYEYEPADPGKSCAYCRAGFESMRKISDPPLEKCPQCGSPVRKLVSAPSVGSSESGLDDRAKNAGFHKLKRLGKGEYEKQY